MGIAHSTLLTGILEPSRLLGEAFWVDDHDMFEIVDRAQRASKLSELGLRLGASGTFTGLGACGLLLSVTESFRQVLHALAHFARVVRDSKCIFVKEVGATLTVEFSELEGPIQFRQCMTEFITSSLSTLLTRYAGPRARFVRAHFDYPAPAHVAVYQQVFDCALEFNQPCLAFVVDAGVADRVQLLAQPALAELLWGLSERQLIPIPKPRTIVNDVQDELRGNLGERPPRMTTLAQRLGMSERSLRRRLSAMKVDYRTLVAERQRAIASQMLQRQGVSVKEVAHELGYGSPSAFHRAFKRWMGVSPKERHRAEDDRFGRAVGTAGGRR